MGVPYTTAYYYIQVHCKLYTCIYNNRVVRLYYIIVVSYDWYGVRGQ